MSGYYNWAILSGNIGLLKNTKKLEIYFVFTKLLVLL